MSSQPFNFEQFRIGSSQEEPAPEQDGFDFSKFRVGGKEELPAEESLPEQLLRNVARLGVTGAAAIGAVPGEIAGLVKTVAEALPQGPEFLQREPTFLGEGAKAALESLPTQEQLLKPSKAIAKKLGFEGFFDPKGEIEEFADEVVSDFAVLATGGPKSIPLRPMLTAIGANLVGKGAEKVTESKKAGAVAKTGAMFASAFMGRPSIREFNRKQFDKVNEIAGGDLRVPSIDLKNDLKNARKVIKAGGEVADDQKILGILEPLLEKSKELTIPTNEVLQARRKISDLRLTKRGFARTAQFKEALDRNLDMLEAVEPGFSKLHRGANEGLRAIIEAEESVARINSILGNKQLSIGGGLVVGALNPQFASVALPVAAARGVAPSAVKLQKILSNPNLRPHINEFMKASAADSLKGIQRSLSAIDKAAQKEHKKGNLDFLQ